MWQANRAKILAQAQAQAQAQAHAGRQFRRRLSRA